MKIPAIITDQNTGETVTFFKVLANRHNREIDKNSTGTKFSGLVFPEGDVPPMYEIKVATPFEVLTQTKAYSHCGADMGRPNVGDKAKSRIFDREVPLYSGYDQGGAYWGIGKPLRVRYTLDLSYARYYREEWEYQIQGYYGAEHGFECVTSETQYFEAKKQIECYRENEPGVTFRIKKMRVLPE